MHTKGLATWLMKIMMLILLYIPIWILGSMAVAGSIPDLPSEPGLMNEGLGMILLATVNTLLIAGLIVTSRWRGWKLSLLLALVYYASFTFLTQLDTWYYLTDITVSAGLLAGLFIMGLPVPLIFIPLAVKICGRWEPVTTEQENLYAEMPKEQWVLKLAVIAILYVIIYWLAGYFIAWQNLELRAFYGSPGEIVPFWEHTITSFGNSPDLVLLQLVRGTLYAAIAIPVIRGSTVSPWLTAVLIGLLLAVPHLAHILPNPLIPMASIRFSHMIETFSSMFLFGLIIVWILHRRHHSLKDLFGTGI